MALAACGKKEEAPAADAASAAAAPAVAEAASAAASAVVAAKDAADNAAAAKDAAGKAADAAKDAAGKAADAAWDAAAAKAANVKRDGIDRPGSVATGSEPKHAAKKARRESAESATETASATSDFPWPPPIASARAVIPSRLFIKGGNRQTFGDVDSALQAALSRTGYVSRGYYLVPDGFAVATRLERFLQNGSPAEADVRWSLNDAAPTHFTVGSFVKSLFATEPGRFRVIVFVVTKQKFAATGQAPTRPDASRWTTGGLNGLPEDVAAHPFDASSDCTALVYEFNKPPGGAAMLLKPGILDGDAHLRASGVLTALGG